MSAMASTSMNRIAMDTRNPCPSRRMRVPRIQTSRKQSLSRCLGGAHASHVVRFGKTLRNTGFPLDPSKGHIVLRHSSTRTCARQVHSSVSASSVSSVDDDPPFGMSQQTSVVVGCAFSLLLCNMCRVCMSIAIMPMSEQFGWSSSVQGLVQSSFLWGYAATQILGGTMADKLGGKRVMTIGIMVFASACAILPVAVIGVQASAMCAAGAVLPLVIASRALVGLGEGVTMPSMNNLLAKHVPPASRARSIGLIFSGFHAGTLLGLLASPIILMKYGWPALFLIYGAFGVPLLFLWARIVPEHVEAPATEAGTASAGNAFAMLLSKPATWAIISANFVNHFNYFIYLNWMPMYFNKVLGFNIKASALYSFLPWFIMSLMSYVAGFLADSLVNRGVNRTTVRKLIQSIAFLGPVIALYPMLTTKSPRSVLTLVVSCFGSCSLQWDCCISTMPTVVFVFN
mmetsp:Transcript_50811/g.94649  ORF Transcript_50811/g.94649 Transcript_50811/m.94649 type:complete len:457 (+) Transcript_50811:40-1410(+)